MIKRQKCTVVAHFHNKPPVPFARKWYNRLLYKSFFRYLHTIFLADCLAETFNDYTRRQLVHICPNGMPEQVTDVQPKKPYKLYTFLFLSNMMEEKGVIVLLEACALLKKRGCGFVCNFVGQWSDITEQRFNSLTEELGISENVHAYGGVYGEKKAKYFSQADAFVFPTYYSAECLPLVLIEAMRYSLPIISTPEGGIPDVIDDKVGFLVEQRNSQALADRMQYLIEHPEGGRKKGEQGRVKYEREYTLPVFERRFVDILTNALYYS
ncbi:MAG: glycosyltransferase family 4 protein [Paludibacteraceae bacterium]|nr:glycosyltransferase family 4 protein [Paludibacteraceae bacterium]